MEPARASLRRAPLGRAVSRAAAALLAVALGAGVPASAQAPRPEEEGRKAAPQARKRPPAGKRGKAILTWEHLKDSDGREFEDFSAFVSYRQAYVQVWSGEFTDGAEIGGYVRDRRRSTYGGLYRFRDGFDHVLQFNTEQVLRNGFVAAGSLRAIRIIPDNVPGDRDQLQVGAGFDRYHGDYDFLSFRGVSDPREGGRWTFITSHRFHRGEEVYVQPGFIIRTDRSTGWFLQGKVRRFRWMVGDFARFDFTEVDRTVYSIGYEIPF
jgi:hypothetical protein